MAITWSIKCKDEEEARLVKEKLQKGIGRKLQRIFMNDEKDTVYLEFE